MAWLKWVIGGLVALGAIVLIGTRVFSVQLGEAGFKRAVESTIGQSALAELEDGLHVVLIGSGSPLGDPTRMGPSTAVIAGNRVFIVDVGSGTPRNYGRFGIPSGRIEGVFLTHFHSDHIDGLGELMLQRWINGSRTEPVPVHGPTGVDRVVNGLNEAYALDSGYRTAHHGEAVAPPSGAGGEARPFSLASPLEAVTVLDEDGLTVTAFAVVHDPVHPAVGYRFDYAGRSVVFSGDTAFSDMLVSQAKGADLLVHEALNAEMVSVLGEALTARGATNLATVMADIPDYHVTPVQAAETAQAAEADMLVINHIVPALPSRALYDYYLDGVSDAYEGPVVLGEDGMLFSLEASRDGITSSRLD